MSQTPEQVLREYESATNSHNFDLVKPLLAEDAIYFFSDGTYQGWTEIQKPSKKTGIQSATNIIKSLM